MTYNSTAIELRLKRGDTFARVVNVKSLGVAYNLAGATIRAQLRKGRADAPGDLVQELAITTSATVGQLTISATATQTALWPVGRHVCDVQITIGAGVTSTETFVVCVSEDVTR